MHAFSSTLTSRTKRFHRDMKKTERPNGISFTAVAVGGRLKQPISEQNGKSAMDKQTDM